MPITSEVAGDKGTVSVVGVLTNNVVGQFETSVQSVISQGAKSVEIDLADVDLICSSAIRVLLQNYKALSGEGKTLAVVNPSDNVRSALETVGFAQLVKPGTSPDDQEIKLSGRIDGDGANQLEVNLVELIRAGVKRIQIDMSGVEFLCSAGIRVLLQYYRQSKKDGNSLLVTQPSAIAREALETTGFTDLIAK